MSNLSSPYWFIIRKTMEFKSWFLMPSIFLTIIISTSACKKFVEVPAPDSQLNTAVVFNNDATATAALTGIYGQMLRNTGLFGNYPSLSINAGLLADELVNYSTDPLQIQMYSNNLTSTSSSLSQFYWSQPYSFIYQANAVIENLAVSNGISSGVKQQLTGEAKFIRAFCHFYLVNLFGDVPLAVSTEYAKNNSATRNSKADVYSQIVADLLDAQSLLNSNYISEKNVTTSERIRPNKWAATAFLARVYLYMGEYAKAEAQATSIINNSTMYSLVLDQTKVFLKNSLEAIWQFQSVNISNINTFDATTFILTAAPTRVALSNQLYNAFETNDSRKSNWVNFTKVGANIYYYPFKYRLRTDASYNEYTMVFRLAEQYLIRAEARAQQSNISGAQADLTMIRSRANLPASPANDKPSLLQAIEHERQVELFTEWGHRWFDLKRNNRADSVLATVKGSNWQSYDVLMPIPLVEIQNNSNLKQNQGY